jgi:hypothetical protein
LLMDKTKIKFLRNQQPKPEEYLWRYMNLKKFLSFIIDRKLHLKRLDRFEDKNDGIFANLLQLRLSLGEIKKRGGKILLEKEELKLRKVQKRLYASCWFVGDRESMAMWKIFSNPDSVAVRIRYRHLSEIFSKRKFSCNVESIEGISLGKIRYYDHNNGKGRKALKDPEKFLAFSKDESFSNEREFRIVIKSEEGSRDEHPDGIDLDLHDFGKIPFEIVFHPKAEDWGVKNLKDIMDKFELDFKSFNSDLDLRHWIMSA